MWTALVDMGGRGVEVRLPPGAYRATYSAPPIGTNDDAACASTSAISPKGSMTTLSNTRRRFHQLRDLRRELSGRPRSDTDALSAAEAPTINTSSAASSLPPTATLARASSSLTSTPSAASHGLPFHRLSADDPVTRSVLRTAAAERALRLQQAENDELKRAVVTWQQEAAQMQCLIDRLSTELSDMSQTVLRQTATLKSMGSEMDRRDAYHLIKEKRSSQAATSAVATANASSGTLSSQSSLNQQQQLVQLRQKIEELTKEKTELQQQVSHFSPHHGGKLSSTLAIEEIEKDDDATGEGTGGGRWVPSARVELQKLVQALAAILRTGASPIACVGADTEPVYEVELSCSTCLVPRSTQRNPNDPALEPAKANSVVCICGPYNMHDVLLRVQPVAEAPMTEIQRSHMLGGVSLQSPRRCVLYAMQNTCSVVRICLYESAADTEVQKGASCSAHSPAPAATAAIAVHTLIATALASRRELEAMPATYNVHTVHLADERGAPRGTFTFRVRVTEVQHRRYRGYGGVNFIDSDSVGCRCTPPFLSPLAGESGDIGILERGAAPRSSADANRVDGESVTKHSQPPQSREPMLSPSRDDDAIPIEGQRLSAYSPYCCSTASPVPADDNNSSNSSKDAMGILEQMEGQSRLPPALLVPAEDSENTLPPAAAKPSGSGFNIPAAPCGISKTQVRDDATPIVTKTTVELPVRAATATLPPGVGASPPSPSTVALLSTPSATSHFWLPAPPLAIVPSPPSSTVPIEIPAAPATCVMRMHIKEVRYLYEDCGDELVGGMLDHCSLQVAVRVDGELVFTTPTRPNPSHAMWNAEEGSFTSTLTSGQEVHFEVRGGDAEGSRGVLPASEILNASGEREVALVFANSGTSCGLLTVAFEGPM
ncbi:hypothetical protein LPMP_350880 [Leishmania panamensis]|uniref:C2 domain-containing protein n=1 Tax=Leishmania panamensis TaxID=5679 RepID=A0A088S3T8_LEIPA|nr:hypothetical protein LPMP_350880 [Leishmania panamensis]AIO02225.1 hypothetical protein LPMP_350880 [Leishmania panamensis]